MAKGTKGGSVFVELLLDADQFNKDIKRVGREVVAEQERLSMQMQRNKVKFAIEGVDPSWSDKMFGNTVIGKMQKAQDATAFLNSQIEIQSKKVAESRNAWANLYAIKGATDAQTLKAEKSYMREQMALAGLKKETEAAAAASGTFSSMLISAASAAAAAVIAVQAAMAAMRSMAVEWGQAVNDLVDETGMSDEAASRLLGTMKIVGLSSEEAAGSIAKMAKTVSAAAQAQSDAARSGKESDDVFTKFGIAIKANDGTLLDHEAILQNITEVHRGMQDGLQKTAMEMAIFGKAGYKLNDLLNLSNAQSKEYQKSLADLGLVIGDSQKYEDYNRAVSLMHLSFVSIAKTLADDTIPQTRKYMEMMPKLAILLRQNKDAAQEAAKGIDGAFGGDLFHGLMVAVDKAVAAMSKLLASRQKALDATKTPKSETDLIDRMTTSAKNAEEIAKKEADALRNKQEKDKQKLESENDLQKAILDLNGYTLSVQLANIDKEAKAWKAKGAGQVEVAIWAEQARAKAHKEAQDKIDASLKDYENALKGVQAAKEGVSGSFQGAFSAAISEVMDNIKKGQGENASVAVQKIRDEYDLRVRATQAVSNAAGYRGDTAMFNPQSAWQQVGKSFDALNEAISAAEKAKEKYLESIRKNSENLGLLKSVVELVSIIAKKNNGGGGGDNDGGKGGGGAKGSNNYNQNQTPDQGYYNQPQFQTVDNNYKIVTTVNVNGMDQQSAQQVGEVAAQQIIPAIEKLTSNPTAYGGGR